VSLIEFVAKLVWSAWPFVKEMVLEGKSLANAFRTNKRRAIFSVVIMASFTFNLLNMGADLRFFSILGKYLELEKTYKAERARNNLLAARLENGCSVAATPDSVSAPVMATEASPASYAAPVTTSSVSSYEALRNTFTGLQPARH
jgi:hypothetical protein